MIMIEEIIMTREIVINLATKKIADQRKEKLTIQGCSIIISLALGTE
jgi:hypothetical protein